MIRISAHGLFWSIICAGWCLATASAAEPRLDKFVKYDTGDFVIITSRSGAQAREIIRQLVKFRMTLEKVLGRHAARSGIGTNIVIASAGDWQKFLQPRKEVAGFFQRRKFDNIMAMNGDLGNYALYVMFHEYTHFYLSSQFSGEYPPWFNEGLAEVMAYAKFMPDNRVALQIPMFRVYETRDKDWIPFERLLQVGYSSPEYKDHELADAFYAQAWLTVHYGMVEDREFGRQFMEYLRQLNQLVPQEQAARDVFQDLGATNDKLRAYSRKSSMASGALDLGAVPEVTLPKPTPLSDADAYAAVIDVMLAGHRDPALIQTLIEALRKREPDAARTWILAARLAQDKDDDAAFLAAIDKAVQLLAADDAQSRRDIGIALLEQRADDEKPLLKRAVNLLAESVRLDAGDARTLWGLGTALTRLNVELDLADTALTSAYERVPASAAISLSLASLRYQQSRYAESIPYLKDTIRHADDLNSRRQATERLAEMQQYVDELKRTEEENRQQREAYEKQMAEYEKKVGKSKKNK